MAIPFIDLNRYESGFLEKVYEKNSKIFGNSQFIGGSEVLTFETNLCAKLEVEHSITCANGTDALQLALRAIGIGKSDKVLVPNLTFWATFEAVVNVGATPVTVDANVDDGGVCFESFKDAIDNTAPKAAIIAHLYGWGSSKILEIRELCEKKNVKLIEDAAQAFGVMHNGISIFKGAYLATTSFYPAKVLGGAGDGGAVFTNDKDIAERVRQLGNHGRMEHYGYGAIGWNSRLDAIQASFLNLSMEHIENRIDSRRKTVEFYNEALPKLGINVMVAPSGYQENGYCNVCLIDDPALKSKIENKLREKKIGFGNIYPSVMSEQPCVEHPKFCHVGGKNAQKICSSVLNLPLFPYMTNQELCEIVSAIEEAIYS